MAIKLRSAINRPTHASFSVQKAPALLGVLAAFCLGTSAVHAEPSGQVRLTEITDTSHPFQTLHCARLPIQFRMLGDSLELVLRNESRMLLPIVSATGARYQSLNDPGTEFWSKGQQVTVSWSGVALPTCAPSGVVITPFRASGNEPFWAVDYDGRVLTLNELGKEPYQLKARVTQTHSQGQTLQAGEGSHQILLQVKDAVCTDTMSGPPRPQQVTLQRGGETLQGCGGDAERLLQGADWKVVSLTNRPIPADVPVWMAFLPDGKLVGNTGCNRFFGAYALTGEGIDIGQLGSTRMACSTERMDIEQEFLQLLMSLRGYVFNAEGELVLQSPGGEVRAVADSATQP